MNCVYLQPSTATGTSAGVVLTPAGVAVDTAQQGPQNMPPMSFLGASGAAADAVASAVLLACELQSSECLTTTTTSGHGDSALPAFIEHAPGFPVGALSAALHCRARAMKPCVGGERQRNAGDVASHPSTDPAEARSPAGGAHADGNDLGELTVALERLEAEVTEEKTSGAAHFKDGNHAAALRCYQRALKALEPAMTHLTLLRRDRDGTGGTSSVAPDSVAVQGDEHAYEAPIRRLAWALQLNACVCCYMIGASSATTTGNVDVITTGSAAEASLLRCERFGKRVLDATPSHPKALLFLAKAASARGEFDACVAWCDTLLALQHGAIDELGLEQYPGALSTDEFASVLHQAAPAVSTLRVAAAQRLTAEKTQQRQAMQRMFAS